MLRIETVVDGEFDVTINGQLVRVFVPAGLGVAGFDDGSFVACVCEVLFNRGTVFPSVLDVAQLCAFDPQLWQQVSDALEDGKADTV